MDAPSVRLFRASSDGRGVHPTGQRFPAARLTVQLACHTRPQTSESTGASPLVSTQRLNRVRFQAKCECNLLSGRFPQASHSLSLFRSGRRGDSECQNRRRTPRDKHRPRTRSPSCVETNGASPVGFACLRTLVSVHERELVEVEDHSAGLGEAVLSGVFGESRLFFRGR